MKENLNRWKNRGLEWVRQNKWLVAGIAIAILNPIPSGVILGIVMLTEVNLRRVGQIVLIIVVVWVVVGFLTFLFVPRRPF